MNEEANVKSKDHELCRSEISVYLARYPVKSWFNYVYRENLRKDNYLNVSYKPVG